MTPGRNHARVTSDAPPRFTPADRLEALDRVAKAARKLMSRYCSADYGGGQMGGMISEPEDYEALEVEVVKLDEIERFLGIAIWIDVKTGP